MKALKLKQMLNEYSDKELQNLDVKVFSTTYLNMGDEVLVDYVEITDGNLQLTI